MADFQALLATASADSAALTGFSAVAHTWGVRNALTCSVQ